MHTALVERNASQTVLDFREDGDIPDGWGRLVDEEETFLVKEAAGILVDDAKAKYANVVVDVGTADEVQYW